MKIDFDFATKDDCLDKLVPSDLRQLVCERDSAIAERDALAATVEALTSAYKNLCGSINDMDDCETGTDEMETAIGAVFHAMRNGYGIVHSTPQQHLRDVRAEAGQDGFIAGAELIIDLVSDGSNTGAYKSHADEYAERVRAGEK